MRISDVAQQIGIPVSTIRFYEKHAVIPKPNRHGRDRSFSEEDVRAIQFVRDAQSLGLPLSEISVLVHGSWNNGDMAKVAAKHRETIRARIEALHRMDRVLEALEACRCESFAECDLNAIQCRRDG